LELTVLGGNQGTVKIRVHHGQTLRWKGPWSWSDVALVDSERFIQWLADRGYDRYLVERAEHAARERQAVADRDARARIAAKIRARWIAAAPDVVRGHAMRTGANESVHGETVAAGLAALRARHGDVEAIRELLRWYGFDSRGAGDDPQWGLTRAYLEAAGDGAVIDAIHAARTTPDATELTGIMRYFLHVGSRRRRMKEVARLPEEIQEHLRRHHQAERSEESAEFDVFLHRAVQALEQRARSRNQRADTPLASSAHDPDEDIVPRRHVHLRMIDVNEYDVMVGGAIDAVWEVLDRSPRPGEHLALGDRSWSLLREFVEPLDGKPRLLLRLWDSNVRPMAGSQGYVVVRQLLEEVVQLIEDVDPEGIRVAHQVATSSREHVLAPSAGRRRSLTARDLKEAVDSFSQVRTFLRTAVAARRSLHIGNDPPARRVFADIHHAASLTAHADRELTPEMRRMENLFPRPVVLHRDQIDPTVHLCRPIGGARDANVPDRPWVAIARARRDGAFVLAERAPDAKSLIESATQKLAACPHEWNVSATRGVLFWKRPSLLRAYGDKMVPVRELTTTGGGIDDLSSDLVLRTDVMEQAAEMLRASSLLVGIPKRGWLLVGAGEPGDFRAMLPMHAAIDGIADGSGRDAISRRVFFYRSGTLFGWSTMAGGTGSLTVTVRDDADPWGLRDTDAGTR
jgi:hypothetical protein